jgi:hypothetical protein
VTGRNLTPMRSRPEGLDRVNRGHTLSQDCWWTDADAAELDLLTHEFVKAARAHKERCPCSGGPWCDPLRAAFDAVIEWRDGRILRSKAEWLRIHQNLLDPREVAAA